MADGCVLTSSEKFSDKNAFESKLNDYYTHDDCIKLVYDGKRLKWIASFESLKIFVEQIIELKGKWSSPGGSSKKFTCSDSDLTITWYLGKQNSLILHGESSSDIANVMIKVCQKTSRDDLTGMAALSVNGESIRNPLDRAMSPTTSNTNSIGELLATSVNDAPTPKALSMTDIQVEDHSKVSPKYIYIRSHRVFISVTVIASF